MKHPKRYTRKTFIKTFAEYGIHLWLILVIASIVSAYAFQFYTKAASPEPEPTTQIAIPIASDSATLTPTVAQDTPTPTDTPPPAGPVANFSFTLPGIGSGSANLDPKRKERKVTIFLYDQNENPNDERVKPLYTIDTTATYDDDPTSETYSHYINQNADLGADVADGTYQIALKTDQSLNNLIKDNDTDIGGKTFDISKGKTFNIKTQKLITGDIHPVDGDNVMDINDYNDFASCYAKQPSCPDPLIADLDDNGVVEGTDYNLLLLNFQTLVQQGQPAPSLGQAAQPTQAAPNDQFVSPTSSKPNPNKKPSPKPQQKTAAASSSAGLIVGLLVFALFIGAVVLAFIKRKTIMALISHKQELTSTTETPSEQGGVETTEQPTEEVAQIPTPEAPAEVQPAQTPAQTQEPATPQPAPEEAKPESNTPTEAPAAATAGTDEKEYYVKKGRVDDAGAGFWLTLTADSGPIEGHYIGTDAKDGFAMIKGEMKNENGKSYMEVSSMKYED